MANINAIARNYVPTVEGDNICSESWNTGIARFQEKLFLYNTVCHIGFVHFSKIFGGPLS